MQKENKFENLNMHQKYYYYYFFVHASHELSLTAGY